MAESLLPHETTPNSRERALAQVDLGVLYGRIQSPSGPKGVIGLHQAT